MNTENKTEKRKELLKKLKQKKYTQSLKRKTKGAKKAIFTKAKENVGEIDMSHLKDLKLSKETLKKLQKYIK